VSRRKRNSPPALNHFDPPRKPVEMLPSDIIMAVRSFLRVKRDDGGVTLVTELSDMTSVTGTRLTTPPRTLLVEGDTATVRFDLHETEWTPGDDVAGWRFIPRLGHGSHALRMPCDLLIIND
jgi:hypothetical protein